MATEDQNLEIPLFVGMGEGKDAQNRTDSAVVSENVSFAKEGSISTRRYLDAVIQHSSDLEGVAYADGEFYVHSDSQIMQVREGDALGPPTTFEMPLVETTSYLKTSDMSVGWVRAVPVGDYVVVSWLESNSVGYRLCMALYDTDNNVVQEAATVYNGGIAPSYELLETPTGVSVVYMLAGVGNPSDAMSVEVVPCTVVGESLIFGSAVTTAIASLGYPKSLSAAATGSDLVIVCNQWPDNTPTTHAGAEGTTFILRCTYDGVLTASAILSSDSLPTAYAGDIFCAVGRDPATSVTWLAVCSGMSIEVCTLGGVTPGPLSTLTSFSPTGSYFAAQDYYNRVGINNPYHFAQLACARFVFSEGTRWLVATSFDHPRARTTRELTTRNYLHTALFALPATPGAASNTYICPHATLAATPYVDASGSIKVPLCLSDGWRKSSDRTNSSQVEVLPMGTQDMVAGGLNSVQQDEVTLSEPLYYTCAIGSIVSGEFVVTSLFGFDEVRPQNGVSLGIELDGSALLQQTRAEAYNEPVGSLVLVGDGLKFYHPRRRVNAGVPHNGTGSGSEGFLQYDAWNHSLAVSDFADTRKLTLVGGRDFLVASMGSVSLVDAGKVFPTAFPTPPDPGLGHFIGSAADPANYLNRSFILLWAWLDSKGVYHRGPPSHEVTAQFSNWTEDSDVATAYVSGLPSLQGVDMSQAFLEVYAEPVTAGVVETGTFKLLHRQSAGGRNPSFSVHMKDSDPAAPLLYTVGGVLPNELRPSQGGVVVAKGRVWSFDKNRVFYSHEVGVDLPVEFNSNLFIDSPDGTPFTGIAAMDEQVVLFTQKGINVARGPGTNRLGSGPGFSLAAITSPTGCRSSASVVETDKGVIFLGERGLHLLGRDFSVTFLRAVEDSFPDSVVSAVYDRTAKEVLFITDSGSFAWDTESLLWTKVDVARTAVNDATWTVDGLAAVTDDTLVRGTGTPLATFPKETSPPMVHSTPWVSLDTAQGYQRVKRFLVQGHVVIGPSYTPEVRDEQDVIVTESTTLPVDPRARLTVRVYTDHNEEPTQTEIFDLRTMARAPLKLNIHNSRQKCSAFRLEFETQESNIELTLTSAVARLASKRGTDKRQATSGT